jgi:hypothetical protein
MTSRTFSLGAAILTLAISSSHARSQEWNGHTTPGNISSASSSLDSSETISGDSSAASTESVPAAFVRSTNAGAIPTSPFRPFSRIGFDSHVGLAGIGFDIATPLARKFNLRTGSDFFGYATAFQEEGADVAINLHMQTAHASLDWFPFGGLFRVSTLMVFANNNRIDATAIIPSGSDVTLNGQDYISSFADPLHGTGQIQFRKVSPGLTVGLGNLIPRSRGHFSAPIDAGFYYVGQPGLKVTFTGSACDPAYPQSIGCESVTQDPGFQQSLNAFVARNNHNLSYASFFPVFSIGFGYSF